MPKFKVGDRVKLISMVPRFGLGPYVKTGAIGIVTHVAGTTQDRPEIYVNFPKHSEWQGMHSEFILVPKTATTTKKPKETKTMNTKKPDTSHGKPTTKGMKEDLKPKAKTAQKPKYPAPREALTYGVTVTGKSTKESIKGLLDLTIEIHNGTLKDLATTGTKLDRTLVDLKEAKAKIKELSKGTEVAK